MLHSTKRRPWGYEIQTTFIDASKNEYNAVLLMREKPTESLINKQVATWGDQIIGQWSNAPEEDETLQKSEVEAILRQKGYLTEAQCFEDLADKDVA